MSLSLLSFNCRGLHGIEKRRDVINFLKQKQKSIYFLQDTHFTEDDVNMVRSMWGYEIFISPGKTGVAILFNNNFEYEIIQVTTDEIGNYLAIDLRIEKYNILLINIYGPNRDSPDFYENIQSKVESFYGDFVVIAGDFNLVQETSLDYYNYKLIGNPKSKENSYSFSKTSVCRKIRLT